MKNNLSKNLIVIKLNELNFDYAKHYIQKYNLLNFKNLINLKSCITTSEVEYKSLEPWIQWVTFNTGKTAAEHKIFRLGDIDNLKDEQIYEKIEKLGFNVGAICPMNTANRLKKPDFFISDPWTKTNNDKNFFNNLLSRCLSEVINNNSQKKIGFFNYLIIFFSILKFVRIKKYNFLFRILKKIYVKKWYRVFLLEFLLNEIYIQNIKRKKTNFSSVFFNGAAHIQHHYFFNLENYEGKRNPEWYLSYRDDPFKDTLFFYDELIGEYLELDQNILILTGLSQIPYNFQKFYYRFKNPSKFLDLLNIEYKNVKSRMTRDFLIEFNNIDDARTALNKLTQLKDKNGIKLFEELDLREKSLFATFTYPHEIKNELLILFEKRLIDIKKFISFVALKNGMHDSRGFAFTNLGNLFENSSEFQLKNFFKKIEEYFKNV